MFKKSKKHCPMGGGINTAPWRGGINTAPWGGGINTALWGVGYKYFKIFVFKLISTCNFGMS